MRYITADYIADELVSQFGIEMDVWDIIRLSAKALKRVGAFAAQRKIMPALITNFQVVLPPDAYLARGVIDLTPRTGFSQVIITDGIEHPPQVVFTQPVEETWVTAPILLASNYIPKLNGPWLPYEYDHPVMKFNETDREVLIEYTGLKIDEEKKPMLPEAASEACLYFCLYSKIQSDYLLNKVDLNKVREVKDWKDSAINQARATLTMEGLNSGQMDQLLNIMVSMDRKAYNIPS